MATYMRIKGSNLKTMRCTAMLSVRMTETGNAKQTIGNKYCDSKVKPVVRSIKRLKEVSACQLG